jgi:hypothetical protein
VGSKAYKIDGGDLGAALGSGVGPEERGEGMG